ncbi:MAG: glycine zipper 2TM domain-containing protein [Chromatiales bacterium]
MKKGLLAIGTLLLIGTMSVSAGPHGPRFEDTAKVIDVRPIYQTIEISHPERSCWDEDVSYYEPGRKTYTGTVLGGIVGGVMANQLYQGHGRGREAATLAGTLLGGAIGHDLSEGHRPGEWVNATERHCEVRDYTTYEESVVGYRVKYRYKGRVFTTRTKDHPGRRIPVRVGVVPLDDI